MPSGRTREWYPGRISSDQFQGAANIKLIQGYSGEETQVDWPFSIPPAATVSVLEQLQEPSLEPAAD